MNIFLYNIIDDPKELIKALEKENRFLVVLPQSINDYMYGVWDDISKKIVGLTTLETVKGVYEYQYNFPAQKPIDIDGIPCSRYKLEKKQVKYVDWSAYQNNIAYATTSYTTTATTSNEWWSGS